HGANGVTGAGTLRYPWGATARRSEEQRMHSPVPASLEACFQLLRAQALLVRRFEVEFGDAHGLGLPDVQLLVELDRAPDGRLRRSELAERMALTAAGASPMLGPAGRLRRVARGPHPAGPTGGLDRAHAGRTGARRRGAGHRHRVRRGSVRRPGAR